MIKFLLNQYEEYPMGINPKVKGAKGELEFCSRYDIFFGETLKRNLLQTREGGADVTGCNPWVIEVKRCQNVEHNKWWRQVNAAVKEAWEIPVVAYRVNNGRWTFQVPSKLLGIECSGFVVTNEDIWLKLVMREQNSKV
jgi:hypothetical protein